MSRSRGGSTSSQESGNGAPPPPPTRLPPAPPISNEHLREFQRSDVSEGDYLSLPRVRLARPRYANTPSNARQRGRALTDGGRQDHFQILAPSPSFLSPLPVISLIPAVPLQHYASQTQVPRETAQLACGGILHPAHTPPTTTPPTAPRYSLFPLAQSLPVSLAASSRSSSSTTGPSAPLSDCRLDFSPFWLNGFSRLRMSF